MKSATVKKEDLLATLEANRDKHINTFDQVLEDYRARAVELLEEHIQRIRDGAVEKVYVMLPPPENYEEEYTRVIEMAKWHQEDTIELTAREFDEYVLDNWTWKDTFLATAATYSTQ